jgi:hypothetical protein
MSKDHTMMALTYYLRSMSLIPKDMEVTKFKKVPEGLEVSVEKFDD